jgi:hypothetical protein
MMWVMTRADLKKQLKIMKQATASATRSKRAARAFLVRAGIAAKGGKTLAKPYR